MAIQGDLAFLPSGIIKKTDIWRQITCIKSFCWMILTLVPRSSFPVTLPGKRRRWIPIVPAVLYIELQ